MWYSIFVGFVIGIVFSFIVELIIGCFVFKAAVEALLEDIRSWQIEMKELFLNIFGGIFVAICVSAIVFFVWVILTVVVALFRPGEF